MKSILAAGALSLALTGCYTILYPPLDYQLNAGAPDSSVLVIPDSLAGRGVIIVNQNQIIMGRYYEDLYYYREGWFGGFYGWDPYFYNPRGYYYRRYWRPGRGNGGDAPGPVTPPEKKERREKDYRRSEAPADNSDIAVQIVSPPQKESSQPAIASPPSPTEPQRSIRSFEPSAASPDDQTERMRRREDERGR